MCAAPDVGWCSVRVALLMCMQVSVLLATPATAATWLEHVSTFMAPLVSQLAYLSPCSLTPYTATLPCAHSHLASLPCLI